MPTDLKPDVSLDATLGVLDIRLGRILEVALAEGAPKRSYRIVADFGKFGVRTSVARLTQHSPEELKGLPILGVLNLGSRQVGDTVSEFLCLGVQFPGADSGEATPITPLNPAAKLGSKLF